MTNTGSKIIDGLRDAVAGNFASVTIEGQRWVRADAPCTREPTDRELEELVARAICKADAGPGESIFKHMREYWTRVAKAAIAAMPPRSAATSAGNSDDHQD